MLELLHTVYQGVLHSIKAKPLVVWWLIINRKIAYMMICCSRSQKSARGNNKLKPLKWESELDWERIDIDYAVSFEGKYF